MKLIDTEIFDMEIKKNCNNCAYYTHSQVRLNCVACWNQSNWQPNEHVQHRILATSDTMDAINNYIKEDIKMTKTSYNYFFPNDESVKNTSKIIFSKNSEMDIRDNIKDVIFNDPATIVLWKDGSKTVVKAQEGELYDPEKGFAMAISKKMLGGHGNYFEVFKKWVPEKEKVTKTFRFDIKLPDFSEAAESIRKFQEEFYKHLDVMTKTEEDETEE